MYIYIYIYSLPEVQYRSNSALHLQSTRAQACRFHAVNRHTCLCKYMKRRVCRYQKGQTLLQVKLFFRSNSSSGQTLLQVKLFFRSKFSECTTRTGYQVDATNHMHVHNCKICAYKLSTCTFIIVKSVRTN